MLLTEYWENRDDQALRSEIEEHVRASSMCAEVFQAYSVTVATFRSAARPREPGAAHRELWERLSRQLPALRQYLP